jgi:hypothetical protein
MGALERGSGGIVVVTPVTVEVWMSWWWNDQGHVGQGVVPMLLLTMHGHVRPISRSGCRGWGGLWLTVLPEGSTCPLGEAEVS